MILHETRLLADDSHEISYLIFSKIRKYVAKRVACYSCDWRFKLKKCMLTPKLMGAATKFDVKFYLTGPEVIKLFPCSTH